MRKKKGKKTTFWLNFAILLLMMLKFEEKYRQFAKFPEIIIPQKMWGKRKQVGIGEIFILLFIISMISLIGCEWLHSSMIGEAAGLD